MTIKLNSSLNLFLAQQLHLGNKIKDTLTDENGATTIILQGSVNATERDAAKNLYELDFSVAPDKTSYVITNNKSQDKIIAPIATELKVLSARIVNKISISTILGLMTIISIIALKLWVLKISNYLEAESLISLKNYTLNNVSILVTIYLILLSAVAVFGYFILGFLNLSMRAILLASIRISFRRVLRAWFSIFLSIAIFWLIYLVSCLVIGYQVLDIYPKTFAVIFIICNCMSSFFFWREIKKHSQIKYYVSHVLLFALNFACSMLFAMYLVCTHYLFKLTTLNFELIIFIVITMLAFTLGVFLASFIKVLPPEEKESSLEKKEKFKELIKNLISVLSFISAFLLPLILFLAVVVQEDAIKWSGIGKREESFIVTPDLEQAINLAATYPNGKNIKQNLAYNSDTRTITAWVVLEIGNRLVLAQSAHAPTKYYFSEDPYRLENIFVANS